MDALGDRGRAPPLGRLGGRRVGPQWVESSDDSKLAAIEEYNRDDCRSTLALRDWLLDEKRQAEQEFRVDIDALQPPEPRERSDEALAREAELAALESALTSGLGEDMDALDVEERARVLAADLLQYHRREARPEWWAYFERIGRSADELRDEDTEAIGDLTPAGDLPLEEEKQSYLHPMRFPAQQHKIEPGQVVDPATDGSVTVARLDDAAGLLWIKRGKRSADKPLPRALIPGRPIPTTAQQDALLALAARVRDRGVAAAPEWTAACDIVARRPPRLRPGVPPLSARPTP